MIKLLLIFLMFIFSSTSLADTKNMIAKCSAIEGSLQRLACFDKLSKKLGLDKPHTKVKKITNSGKWLTKESISKIDDSKTVTLFLDAKNTIKGRFNVERPSMIIRCAENKTALYINTNIYLGIDETRVLSRLGKSKARTTNWYISTDNKAVFHPKPIGFSKKMFNYDSLLIELTPYGENPAQIEFDIRGLKHAIAPLRKACNW